MFTIHMLDAAHGDCLWIEYGDPDRPRRILIDTGPAATYTGSLKHRIAEVVAAEGQCVFELFVVTHVDDDHIGGALRFLDEMAVNRVKIREVWFNGYHHLSNSVPDVLGAMQGEQLTELIRRTGLPWNRRFQQRAVMVPEEGPLRTVTVGGMKLTVLSPTLERLKALEPAWEKTIRAAGLVPGKAFRSRETVLAKGFLGDDIEDLAASRFREDRTLPNGTSIAFLAEFEGTRVLFAADAHPRVLLQSLARAPFKGVAQAVDAFKLSHHGSAKNTSRELLEAFPSARYLVSTTGARFEHPDPPAIARVVTVAREREPTLFFNCESEFNREWQSGTRQRRYGYQTECGQPGEGLLVTLA
jgi:beta-lactamase superfamily II metal-dependent hydrolase